MNKHGYTHKLNDEALSQNQIRAKLGFLKSTLLWCKSRSFVASCAEWIPYGEERCKDLEDALLKRMFSTRPAEPIVTRPYNKPKPSVLSLA